MAIGGDELIHDIAGSKRMLERVRSVALGEERLRGFAQEHGAAPPQFGIGLIKFDELVLQLLRAVENVANKIDGHTNRLAHADRDVQDEIVGTVGPSAQRAFSPVALRLRLRPLLDGDPLRLERPIPLRPRFRPLPDGGTRKEQQRGRRGPGERQRAPSAGAALARADLPWARREWRRRSRRCAP